MNRDVVLAEWRRSTQSLRAAELLSREDYREDAVSRAYYAILHAAKAALLVHDVTTASHAGVRRMFGRHLVHTGYIEGRWSNYLARGSDDRLMADYDTGMSFTAEESGLECQRAREFVERIRQYLLAKGLPSRNSNRSTAIEWRDGHALALHTRLVLHHAGSGLYGFFASGFS